ncbi:MAG TPA: UbiD family decarboxylase, partial [Chloroflexota bacterium]|nr:UbiD family decarboxylase [Chloroflexota bacterium]
MKYRDLRGWLALAEQFGQLERIEGAHTDLEIGGLTEMLSLDSHFGRCLLFDDIQGYPSGWRIAANLFATKELAASVLGLPHDRSRREIDEAWRAKSRKLEPMPVKVVDGGPVLENVLCAADVDLTRFPTPRWHEQDIGRYLGTGDIVITRDPETGQINVGTYRMMLHDRDKIGLYISPGHHGRIHRDKYFARGEPMPVAAVFGMDPLLFIAGSTGLSIGTNEYEWAGAVRGEPIEVLNGSVTGLPIPADAEIAIEGYVYPDPMLDEGPFGEWTGYYASAVRQEPFVKVEALYHRNEPIILGYCPTRPPGQTTQVNSIIVQAAVWDALEAAGVPDIKAVSMVPAAGRGMLVISLRQRYGGHARQAALVAGQCREAAYLGRYVVVVDEDIDPHDVDQVLWALWTRCDPEESFDLIRGGWSTPLDPRISPEKRAKGDFTSSRMIIDATRPFHWRDK